MRPVTVGFYRYTCHSGLAADALRTAQPLARICEQPRQLHCFCRCYGSSRRGDLTICVAEDSVHLWLPVEALYFICCPNKHPLYPHLNPASPSWQKEYLAGQEGNVQPAFIDKHGAFFFLLQGALRCWYLNERVQDGIFSLKMLYTSVQGPFNFEVSLCGLILSHNFLAIEIKIGFFTCGHSLKTSTPGSPSCICIVSGVLFKPSESVCGSW